MTDIASGNTIATAETARLHRHDPLTDRAIRGLSPRETPIDVRDGGQPGLVLSVLPSGRKQFTVRYRFQGKQRRLLLGEYPAVTLAVARKRAKGPKRDR